MPMKLRALVRRLAQRELDWQGRHLLAPVVAPGRATVRLDGLVYRFVIRPAESRGFAVFRLARQGHADWVREATAREREEYLRLWPRRRLRLLSELEPGSWLAHPVQATGGLPLVVHEVAHGSRFQLVEAAFDGANCWFCGAVLNTRLALAEEMNAALRDHVIPGELRLTGLTPEDRAAYAFLYRPVARVGEESSDSSERRDEYRLAAALGRGGGVLERFALDGDNTFQVHWRDSTGARQFSYVRRDDLTVVSSGICLSGRDADFDLTSLVGVMEESDR